LQQPGAKHEMGAQIFNVRGGHHWFPAGDGRDLAASPLATSSTEIISQQIYSTEVSKNLDKRFDEIVKTRRKSRQVD